MKLHFLKNLKKQLEIYWKKKKKNTAFNPKLPWLCFLPQRKIAPKEFRKPNFQHTHTHRGEHALFLPDTDTGNGGEIWSLLGCKMEYDCHKICFCSKEEENATWRSVTIWLIGENNPRRSKTRSGEYFRYVGCSWKTATKNLHPRDPKKKNK
jgi:hypothetical protein